MLKEAVLAVFLLFVITVVMYLTDDQPRVIRYDCSIAEISPDYPVEVKEQCRQLMRNRIST